MGVLQVLGTYISSQLIDRLGRRTILLISPFGGLVALLVTAMSSYLGKHGYDMSSFSILPVISISFYVFICAIGLMPVPYVMASEVLPLRVCILCIDLCLYRNCKQSIHFRLGEPACHFTYAQTT